MDQVHWLLLDEQDQGREKTDRDNRKFPEIVKHQIRVKEIPGTPLHHDMAPITLIR